MKEYPNIRNYLRELYQIPEIQSTVHMDHIKWGYYCAIKHLNAFRYNGFAALTSVTRYAIKLTLSLFPHYRSIVPAGPDVLGDLVLPHDRDRF